ncbi:MAG TPA: glycosyltransferase family 4 protein [Leptolyngbyaceae cyanobacterium M33_DOE_097]|uniref:Glycosyltransferase n=1 Tax=Oscillatoriales cyanobacterium SpSt-418 TaxID=2282169 RepID=A0A7C3KBP1_9CYAN|nr:glycosyltransferase family 4 protein [Leptolyngbyaceae cyanobacterium M33_DOE_097]
MKITFVMGSGFNMSGGDRVVATYAEKLWQRGHDVLVVSRSLYKPSYGERLSSFLKGKGWRAPKWKGSHFEYVNVPHRRIGKFRPVVDADLPDADVVIATWWETAHWVHRLAPSKGAKVHLIQHHEVFEELPQSEQQRACYRLPLHKITISNWLVDILHQNYGIAKSSITLIPNSVDFNMFNAFPRPKQAVPTVGMLYSRHPWKGCKNSLQAFSQAAKVIPNLQLVTFGAIHPEPTLPLPDRCTFYYNPPQSTLSQIYGACDAWLFGSILEGFGLPILEAMACRTPVIGTPAGAAPELLSAAAGVLVPFEDVDAMAAAIVEVCQMSEQNWRSLSERAYQRATAYTWDDAVDRFEAALHQAMVEQAAQRLHPLVTSGAS